MRFVLTRESCNMSATVRSGGVQYNSGIALQGNGIIQTRAGDIELVGVGGASSTGSNKGVVALNGFSVSTVDGNISISGVGGTSTSGGFHNGIEFRNDIHVISTGSGDIELHGTGLQSARGILIAWTGLSSSIRSEGTGNIHLDGTGIGGAPGIDIGFNTAVDVSVIGGGSVEITGVSDSGDGVVLP
ncbi:MAG: hypothetical protein HQ518_24255 [Rhodopirellula sp.]|nr:hypothetical protein [Rhodopirellula sp.]